MNNYNPAIHHRRSIRLKGYDYSKAGLYFITLCCQNRIQRFGHIENGALILNEYGKIANEEWLKTIEMRKNIALHEYIFMPDHMHAIIEILFSQNKEPDHIGKFKSPSQTIGAIIRGFKGASTNRIKEFYFSKKNSGGELPFAPEEEFLLEEKLWQRDYHDRIINNERQYYNISNYIKRNPSKWEADRFNKKKDGDKKAD
jgi:putative transposase